MGNSGTPLFTAHGRLIGIVRAKSVMKHPLISAILQALEKPGVELAYGTVRAAAGIDVDLTLSKAIQTLMRWISDNLQTNIGVAVSAKHLAELLGRQR